MPKYATFSVLLTSITILVLTSRFAAAGQNESYLIREKLLKGYDAMTRPVSNSSDPVYLSVSIGIKSVIELNMKKQTLVSFGWLMVSWYDHFLTWDAEEYAAKVVLLPADMLWHPELVVLNTVSKLDQLEDLKIKIIVRSDGKIAWYPGGLFETFCSIDISHYPLDTQTCSIDIVAWSSDNSILNATVNDPALVVSNLESHPEWTLLRTEAVYYLRPDNFWVVSFKFTLRRKVMFYVINIMLPIVLLSLMNCLVFLLPVESGEKMTVSVTVFLSFAVFMSLINDSLPQNSDSLCLFSAYVAMQMCLSVCSIFMAAVIVFNFDKDRDSTSFDLSHSQPHSSSATESMTLFQSADSFSPSESTVSSSATIVTKCSSTNIDSTVPNVTGNGISGFSVARELPDTDKEAATPAVSEAGERGHKGSSSIQLAWRLMTKAKNLTPHERQWLSRTLDRMCFVVTVSVNVFSCLTFIVLMIVT